jgi:hypothetical protein
MLPVSEEEFRRYSALDFATRPRWSESDMAPLYSTAQLAWWVQFLALQASKGYDPSVNFVGVEEAHLLLGLTRDGFLRFLTENPNLRPALSLRPDNRRVYHREQLASLRWSVAFRSGSARA